MGHLALTNEYEDLRYNLREDPENIVLEGLCIDCKQHGVIEMKIVQYYRRVAYAHDVHLKGLTITCPKCNTRKTLQLLNLLERSIKVCYRLFNPCTSTINCITWSDSVANASSF